MERVININKKLQKAERVYRKWLTEQTDDLNLELSVEVFMSHYLYQDLLRLTNEPVEELGAYIKVYLHYSQEELKRIRERRLMN